MHAQSFRKLWRKGEERPLASSITIRRLEVSKRAALASVAFGTSSMMIFHSLGTLV